MRLGKKILSAFVLIAAAANSGAEEATWTPNFRDADIREVIHFVSDALETDSLVIDPLVKGKVDVISNVPLNRKKLFKLFINVLDVHGFTAVNNDGVLRVIHAKKARSAPGPVDDSQGHITQVIRLKHISATKVLPVLRPLVPQFSHLAAYGNNALVISDSAANVKRIRKVIESLDTSAEQETELIKIRYGHASDIVKTINQLYGKAANKNISQAKVQFIAEPRSNGILVKADSLGMADARELILQLDRPGVQSGNVRVIYLDYANAEDLEKVIQGIIGELNSQQKIKASVKADKSTNSLLINAEGDYLNTLLGVVQRLDIRRPMVLVEAIIVEISDNFDKNLGVEWLFVDERNGNFGGTINPNSNIGKLSSALNQDSGTSITGPVAGALSTIPGTTLGIGRLNSKLNFSVVVNALQSKVGANILSTPSLLTLDNQTAVLNVGQEVPFVTGSYSNTGDSSNNVGNPFQTIQRQNVGITLDVTPHISQGGAMQLEIKQTVSSLSSSTQATDLITNNRSLETRVLIENGETVILGGLIQENYQDTERKVPLLGSLPLFGRLFRSNGSELVKTNLMVFIRARIIQDNESIYGATAEKYQRIRKQQIRIRDNNSGFFSRQDIPVLPEWPNKKTTKNNSGKGSADNAKP